MAYCIATYETNATNAVFNYMNIVVVDTAVCTKSNTIMPKKKRKKVTHSCVYNL